METSRPRPMATSSSVSRCGRSSERWSRSCRRRKSSLAESVGFGPSRSVHRKPKALTSSAESDLTTSSRRRWKSISWCRRRLARSRSAPQPVKCRVSRHRVNSVERATPHTHRDGEQQLRREIKVVRFAPSDAGACPDTSRR